MRSETTNGRSTTRRRSTAGGYLATGFVLAATLMALAPLASAQVTIGHGPGRSTWQPTWSSTSNGCATAKASRPQFDIATGVGKWSATVSAKTCSRNDGGPTVLSTANAQDAIAVDLAIPLSSGTGGVNVTWALNISWGVIASVPKPNLCPVTTTVNDAYYAWLGSWDNQTVSQSYCALSLSASLSGYAQLVDQTNGTTYWPTNGWNGFDLGYSHSNQTYYSISNYSNSSDWVDNGTSYYTYGGSYGLTGSGLLSAAGSPTWFFNGSFVATHHYTLEVYISGNVWTSITGYPASSIRAYLDAAGAHGYDDLQTATW